MTSEERVSTICPYSDYTAVGVFVLVFSIPLTAICLFFSLRGVLWTWIEVFGGAIGICLGFYLLMKGRTEITITDEGIRVFCGQKEILPFTRWSSFGAAYFLTIDYEVMGVTFGEKRGELKYLLLTQHPIPEKEMRRQAIRLTRKTPYAVFGEDIVLRAEEKDADLIRKHLGDGLQIEKRDFVVNLRDKA